MTAFLLATLYAPIASWGDITVGERRTTWDRPSRSAILGLIGAALGLDRADQDAHDTLDQGYGVAVRVDAPGRPMSDYHTAQSLSQTEMRRSGANTRRQMMTHGEKHKNLETMLSRREYRVDAAYTIVLWQRGTARWSLQEVADALIAPAFVLYAGRKANPLALPFFPRILEAENLLMALSQREPFGGEFPELWHQLRTGGFRKTNAAVSLSSDDDREVGIALGANDFRIEIRRDTGPNRKRWQFAERRQLTGQVTLPVASQPKEARP